MKFIGIIPARYASTRFPGKPLADIFGKPMIRWVYENSSGMIDFVVVATDDNRIYDTVNKFGGKVVMTSPHHTSGTDRCNEAMDIVVREFRQSFDVVINIQGDEPFINPSQIKSVMDCFKDPDTQIATIIKPVTCPDDLFNPNIPKVIINLKNEAVYFSRSAIPYIRNTVQEEWVKKHVFYRHIGLYAYRNDILKKITGLAPSTLEKAESLEQLRWLENGFRIRTAFTEDESIPVDTPEDIDKILRTRIP